MGFPLPQISHDLKPKKSRLLIRPFPLHPGHTNHRHIIHAEASQRRPPATNGHIFVFASVSVIRITSPYSQRSCRKSFCLRHCFTFPMKSLHVHLTPFAGIGSAKHQLCPAAAPKDRLPYITPVLHPRVLLKGLPFVLVYGHCNL